jgi:Flp pilus assembly protein TadG
VRCAFDFWRGERGDAGPLEMVILTPVLLLMFAVVVLFGRATTADTDVAHAARVGARAAAAAQSMAGAHRRAATVVAESLADSGLSCVQRSVSVAGSLQPGGRITVTVRCVASLADVTRYGFIPGSRTLTATAAEVIDVRRGGG